MAPEDTRVVILSGGVASAEMEEVDLAELTRSDVGGCFERGAASAFSGVADCLVDDDKLQGLVAMPLTATVGDETSVGATMASSRPVIDLDCSAAVRTGLVSIKIASRDGLVGDTTDCSFSGVAA